MYRIVPMNMSRGGGENARLWGYEVSGNYFDMLGVKPIRGRVLHPEDDVKRGGHPLAVISYSCWQGRFGGDPDIAGKKVKIGGLEYTIVGVTPPAFIGTELIYTPEIFVPMAMAEQIEAITMAGRARQWQWLGGRPAETGRFDEERRGGHQYHRQPSLAANIRKTTRAFPSCSRRPAWPAPFCAEPSPDSPRC